MAIALDSSTAKLLSTALDVLYVADEFQCIRLVEAALSSIKKYAISSTPAEVAMLFKKVYESDEERVCDSALKQVLEGLCAGPFRHDRAYVDSAEYTDVLRDIPDLALEVALAYHYDHEPMPTRHYLTVVCEQTQCRISGQRWYYQLDSRTWSTKLRCVGCGSSGVRTSIGRMKANWKETAKSARCGRLTFQYSADVPLENAFCIVCASQKLGSA